MIAQLESLYLERRHFLVRAGQSMGLSDADSQDLAQEVLLRFIRRGYGEEEGQSEGRIRSLLARMAYNYVVDCSRRRREACFDADGWPELGLPAAQIQAQERVAELLAQAELNASQLQLIELRFGEGLSLAAIARQQQRHVNTIRRRLEDILALLERMSRRLAQVQTQSEREI